MRDIPWMSVCWPSSLLHRTIVSLFVVADFWLSVNSPNNHCPNYLRLAGWPTWTFPISTNSHWDPWFCRRLFATSSRPRRWCPNFQRQVSLHALENYGPGSCLQQRVSSHVRSTTQLLATHENLTMRHFDLNTLRLVSQHVVLWDSNLPD